MQNGCFHIFCFNAPPNVPFIEWFSSRKNTDIRKAFQKQDSFCQYFYLFFENVFKLVQLGSVFTTFIDFTSFLFTLILLEQNNHDDCEYNTAKIVTYFLPFSIISLFWTCIRFFLFKVRISYIASGCLEHCIDESRKWGLRFTAKRVLYRLYENMK